MFFSITLKPIYFSRNVVNIHIIDILECPTYNMSLTLMPKPKGSTRTSIKIQKKCIKFQKPLSTDVCIDFTKNAYEYKFIYVYSYVHCRI